MDERRVRPNVLSLSYQGMSDGLCFALLWMRGSHEGGLSPAGTRILVKKMADLLDLLIS